MNDNFYSHYTLALGHIARAQLALTNAAVAIQALPERDRSRIITDWLSAAEDAMAEVRQVLGAGIASHHSATTPGPDHITVQGEPSDV
jgi:hypothetical protein